MTTDKWTETLTELAEAIRTSEIPGDLGISQVTLATTWDFEGEEALEATVVMDGEDPDGWSGELTHALATNGNTLAARHGLDHYVFFRIYSPQEWADKDRPDDEEEA
ncbi:hypothetical protein [Herbidospora daliensis]|uniref:hypothetical protein n=1 Tax=Herbidospora daliensis TaxID=295585 RepID=UPI000782B49D|nr:hypothetical protein [Herbidospora daliensis]